MSVSSREFLTQDYEGDLLGQMARYQEVVSESVSDGITFADVAMILFGGMRIAVVAIDNLPLDNLTRKAVVVQVVSKLFDIYAPLAVPPMLKPFWFLLAPSARKIAQTVVSGGIEFILPIVRESEVQ